MPAKFYYFDVYGKGECIRMALTKAGVAFEDLQMAGDAWKELKETGKPTFGQLPLLELEDGTCLLQTTAICNYLGAVYKLAPEDPLAQYKGQVICEHMWNDFFGKYVPSTLFMPPGAERDEKLKVLMTEFQKFCVNLAKLLPEDKKFISGDTTTVYDFQVAGFFTNLVLNEFAKDKDVWAVEWEKAPARVKQYVADFQEDQKDYLAARPKGTRTV